MVVLSSQYTDLPWIEQQIVIHDGCVHKWLESYEGSEHAVVEGYRWGGRQEACWAQSGEPQSVLPHPPPAAGDGIAHSPHHMSLCKQKLRAHKGALQ